MRKNVLLGTMLAVSVLSSSFAYASDQSSEAQFGFINIREEGINLKTSQEAYDMSGKSLGILKISPTQIQKIQKETMDEGASDAAQKILSELQSVEEAHRKSDWATAEKIMRVIYTRHPDLPVFGKWVAIYQNRNREYKDSLATIASLREAFPLDKNIQNSFLFDYYILDNVRGMKDYRMADTILQIMKEKVGVMKNEKTTNNGTISMIMKNKELMQTLLAYQEVMLYKDATGEIKKDSLDKLWNMIPKNKQRTLDHYAGFDLSELGYIYGITYARKDVLTAYVRQKEYSYDGETINKIRTAKKVIYDEN
jgi:hypothetical protein